MLEIVLNTISFIALAYISVGVLVKNPHSWTNRFFFLLGMTLCAYVVANQFSLHPPGSAPDEQLRWIRIVMAIAAVKATLLLLLIHTFPNEHISLKPAYIAGLTVTMVAAAGAAILPLVFQSLSLAGGEAVPIAGYGMPLFIIHFGGSVVASFIILITKYRANRGLERVRYAEFLFGIASTFVLIVVFTLLSVLVFKTSATIFLGPIAPLLLMGTVAHTIAKHRFLDMQPMIARAVSYIFVIIILAALYTGLLFVGATVFLNSFVPDKNVLAIAAMLTTVAALTFDPLKRLVRHATDRLFFKDTYDADALLAKLTRMMISEINLDTLTRNIIATITKEIRITKGAFLIVDNHAITAVKGVGFNDDDLRDETLEKFIHENVADSGRVVMLETLTNEAHKEKFRSHDISVLIPISVGSNEVALLVLGPKLAGDLYTKKDIMLLDIFASEAGITIQNAKLYENLKSALEVKSQFISVVSHQMRTPISAIRWSLELLQQKGLTKEKQREFVANAYHSSIFVVEQLDDVLTALAIQDEKVPLQKEACDLIPIVDEIIAFFTHQLDDKQLKITSELAGFSKNVICDTAKIKKVLRVLIYNAITYTPAKGVITIRSEEKDRNGTRQLIVSVQDTGIGLTEEEKAHMFERFYRSEKARLMLPDGMGLGMFIAHEFVKAHGGELWTESKGRDKGSTFYFSIPVAEHADK